MASVNAVAVSGNPAPRWAGGKFVWSNYDRKRSALDV